MSHSFFIAIDESGDAGLDLQRDCSKWFVLSGIVGLQNSVSDLTQQIKDLKADIGWKLKKPLHFKDLKCHGRKTAIQRFVANGRLFRAIAVMVYKPCLESPERFEERNRLYFYFSRFLLERASWLCRESAEFTRRQHGDGTATVIFSGMNETSRQEVAQYFDTLESQATEIDWRVIRPRQFETLSNGKHPGLQIADTVAGAFYCPDHHCPKNRTDDWVEMLRPVMYRSKRGRYRGYGVKIFPAGAEKQIAQGALAPWAKAFYPE